MIAISFASCWPRSRPGWGMFFISGGRRLGLTLAEAARYANSFTRPGPSCSTMGAQCCPGVSLWAKIPPALSWEQRSGKINDEIHSAGPSLPVPGRSARRFQTLKVEQKHTWRGIFISDAPPVSRKVNGNTRGKAFSLGHLFFGSRKFPELSCQNILDWFF